MEHAKSKPPLGSGERFAALKAKLAKRGARTPKALAAWIGRKKHGAGKMAELAAKGRRRRKKKIASSKRAMGG